MKNLLILLGFLIPLSPAFAQINDDDDVQTLINSNTRIGAYVSFENQFKDFSTTFPGVYSGARLGFVFNRNLFVGFGAYGLSNEITVKDVFEAGDEFEIESGFGGLSLEYILFPKRSIHVSFPCMLAVGGASIREKGIVWNRTYDDDVFWLFGFD